MAKADSLRRLCEIRRAEEQYQASLLESARSELQRIEGALKATSVRRRAGRALLDDGNRSGVLRDRIAGSEEITCALRALNVLLVRKQVIQEQFQGIRDQYLAKRRELLQVETLLRNELQREGETESRRSQASLDDWHRTLHFGSARESAEDQILEGSERD